MQSVRKVNEGPRAGFRVVNAKAESGLRGRQDDVSLITCGASGDGNTSSIKYQLTRNVR